MKRGTKTRRLVPTDRVGKARKGAHSNRINSSACGGYPSSGITARKFYGSHSGFWRSSNLKHEKG